ncbi:hypothetical protein ACIQV3_22495 [Streptomyces sp. NPDC099050]|uniref:hypothetical protein n=1 Tax=Streptomyces sp. NPDC099050 TaxID=3366100 RepID=UPI00382247F6
MALTPAEEHADLVERFIELQKQMAAPLPTAEELAAWAAEDRAMVPKVRAIRPGVPAHHVFAVLQALHVINRAAS